MLSWHGSANVHTLDFAMGLSVVQIFSFCYFFSTTSFSVLSFHSLVNPAKGLWRTGSFSSGSGRQTCFGAFWGKKNNTFYGVKKTGVLGPLFPEKYGRNRKTSIALHALLWYWATFLFFWNLRWMGVWTLKLKRSLCVLHCATPRYAIRGVSKTQDTWFIIITLANVNRFSKFVHSHIRKKIL